MTNLPSPAELSPQCDYLSQYRAARNAVIDWDNVMKKLISMVCVAAATVFAGSAFAQMPPPAPAPVVVAPPAMPGHAAEVRHERREIRHEMRRERREMHREIRRERREMRHVRRELRHERRRLRHLHRWHG